MSLESNFSALYALRRSVNILHSKPNIENLNYTKDALDKMSNVQDIFKFLLTPPVIHLGTEKLSKDQKLHLINYMECVIRKIKIIDLNSFLNIYMVLLVEIYADRVFSKVLEGHEEFKESILKCWKALLERTSVSVVEEFYTKEYIAKLAAGIHACALIAKFEKAVSLKLIAMETMMHFLQIHDNVDESDISLRDQIADVLMLFLPGVSSLMYEISTASDIQHHSVTVLAIKVLRKYLSFIMKDSTEAEGLFDLVSKHTEDVSEFVPILYKGMNEDITKQKLKECKRTPQWYKFAAEKLVIIFEKLKILSSHTHYKVRKELVYFVNEVLFSSTRNLRPCFENLLQILVALTEDESEEIVVATNNIIDSLYEKSEDNDIKYILDTCEENLYNLLTKLPRIIRTCDDSTQMISLKELTGYLKTLQKRRLSHIMTSNAHSNKLIIALAYTVELDCSSISLINDITITNIDDTDGLANCRQYKFIFNPCIENKIKLICHILGESDCRQSLIDSIFKFITSMPQYRKEMILLMNWILEADRDMPISLYKQIIEQYILSDFWYLPDTVSEDIALSTAQSNVVQCCLLTDGLGIIAEKLQMNYDQFLLKTLYIIIERAGKENRYLSYSGRQCLHKVAKALNCKSVTDLLQANVDYISYYVSIKLHKYEINSNVLNAIKVVMENSVIDFLPSLKSIIDKIFLNIRKKSKKQNVIIYLKVFYIFTVSVKRMIVETNTIQNETLNVEKISCAEAIINTIVEYAQAKQNALNFEDNTDNIITEDEIEEGVDKYKEEESAEDPSEQPYYIKLIEDIVKNCLNYLPSKEIEISLLSMSILNECLLILSKKEDILLPMVHQTWHPLVERFQDNNPIIINRAWDLLVTLTNVSKDFIRHRTLKEILPSIKNILTKFAEKSYKVNNTFYEYTQGYKLQKNLLSQLGKVCINLQISEEQMWTVLSIVQPYLSALQYPKLQESCIALFEDFIKYNADVVWVKCLALWHSKIEPIPKDEFDSWYKKIHECNIENEYLKNLKTIFSTIQETEQIFFKTGYTNCSK